MLSLEAFAFLDCLGGTEEKVLLKDIRSGGNGEKQKKVSKVLCCQFRVWKGNLHSPRRKIKMLIFTCGLAMTGNYLCPRAPPAIYGEHHHQELIPDKPQPEEGSVLVSPMYYYYYYRHSSLSVHLPPTCPSHGPYSGPWIHLSPNSLCQKIPMSLKISPSFLPPPTPSSPIGH